MAKKYDSDIVGWVTRGGKRIPIRKGQGKGAERDMGVVGFKNQGDGERKPVLAKKTPTEKAKVGDSRKIDEIKSATKKDVEKKKPEKSLNEKQIKSVQAQVEKLREKAKRNGDPEEVKRIESKIALLEDKIRTDEGRKTVKDISKGLIAEAESHADAVTKDLQSAVEGTGSIDSGLPFRVKTEGSLSRKLKMKARQKGISEEEYARKVTDVLRFTDYADEDKLANSFHSTKKNLESMGYEMIECTNTFHLKKAPYRGINTLVKSPDGYTFELQFHTPQSFEIKEKNHKMYEEQRLEGTTQDRKKELAFEMKRNAMKIRTPKGIESVKDIK